MWPPPCGQESAEVHARGDNHCHERETGSCPLRWHPGLGCSTLLGASPPTRASVQQSRTSTDCPTAVDARSAQRLRSADLPGNRTKRPCACICTKSSKADSCVRSAIATASVIKSTVSNVIKSCARPYAKAARSSVTHQALRNSGPFLIKNVVSASPRCLVG